MKIKVKDILKILELNPYFKNLDNKISIINKVYTQMIDNEIVFAKHSSYPISNLVDKQDSYSKYLLKDFGIDVPFYGYSLYLIMQYIVREINIIDDYLLTISKNNLVYDAVYLNANVIIGNKTPQITENLLTLLYETYGKRKVDTLEVSVSNDLGILGKVVNKQVYYNEFNFTTNYFSYDSLLTADVGQISSVEYAVRDKVINLDDSKEIDMTISLGTGNEEPLI